MRTILRFKIRATIICFLPFITVLDFFITGALEKMSKTYKFITHHRGKCIYCGHDPKYANKQKTKKKKFFKFNLYPNVFLEAKMSNL